MEVLKPIVFYGGFEAQGILGVLKPMVFYGGSETYVILWRF